jgi:hypothetical protein
MRHWMWVAVLVAGCDATGGAGFFDLPTPAPGTGGGGGGGGTAHSSVRTADPLPAVNCPVDYSAQLERDIEAVPDERTHDALYVQWRNLEKVANAAGPTELNAIAQNIRQTVDRAEGDGRMGPDLATHMRGLLHCYGTP